MIVRFLNELTQFGRTDVELIIESETGEFEPFREWRQFNANDSDQAKITEALRSVEVHISREQLKVGRTIKETANSSDVKIDKRA